MARQGLVPGHFALTWFRDIDRWFCEEISPYESQYTALAIRLTGNIDNARDLVHDAYAGRTLEKWQQIDNPRAYMMRTVYNLGLNLIRRSRVVTMQQLADADAITHVDISPDAFDTFPIAKNWDAYSLPSRNSRHNAEK